MYLNIELTDFEDLNYVGNYYKSEVLNIEVLTFEVLKHI